MRRGNLGWIGSFAIALGAAMALGSFGCGDEECLVHGENCSQAYKQNEYGTTEVYCCEGSCQEGVISGALVCQ